MKKIKKIILYLKNKTSINVLSNYVEDLEIADIHEKRRMDSSGILKTEKECNYVFLKFARKVFNDSNVFSDKESWKEYQAFIDNGYVEEEHIFNFVRIDFCGFNKNNDECFIICQPNNVRKQLENQKLIVTSKYIYIEVGKNNLINDEGNDDEK